MPYSNATYDVITSFAFSVIEGFILVMSNTDDIMKHWEKCYKKALDK